MMSYGNESAREVGKSKTIHCVHHSIGPNLTDYFFRKISDGWQLQRMHTEQKLSNIFLSYLLLGKSDLDEI